MITEIRYSHAVEFTRGAWRRLSRKQIRVLFMSRWPGEPLTTGQGAAKPAITLCPGEGIGK